MGIIITNEVEQTDEWRDRHMDRQTETGQNRNIGYKNQMRQCPSDTGGAVHTATNCVGERGCANPVDSPSLTSLDTGRYVSTGPSALRFPETVQETGSFGGTRSKTHLEPSTEVQTRKTPTKENHLGL